MLPHIPISIQISHIHGKRAYFSIRRLPYLQPRVGFFQRLRQAMLQLAEEFGIQFQARFKVVLSDKVILFYKATDKITGGGYFNQFKVSQTAMQQRLLSSSTVRSSK